MLQITPARSGADTAILNGVRLHSTYDPTREAERFVRAAINGKHFSTILLLGAGLGHIIRAVTECCPHAKLIVVFYSQEIFSWCREKPSFCWLPGRPQSILSFLREQVHELDLEGLKILEWTPSSRAFPELSKAANQTVGQLIKELRGSLVTTIAFGKRWIRNSFLNFLSLDSILRVNSERSDLPILIAASGPSLEKIADHISAFRRRLYLWALPSAVLFLLENGLKPDLVVITDPGFYAMYHLHPARSLGLQLAMPLSAAPGAWRISGKAYLISQDIFFENALLAGTGLSVPTIPSKGTVAATALALALKMTGKKVIFAGLDFCYDDIKPYVRPNAFEPLLLKGENRFNPFNDQMFTRALDFAPIVEKKEGNSLRFNLTMKTYSGWFGSLKGDLAKRLYRLNPRGAALKGITDIEVNDLPRMIEAGAPKPAGSQFIPETGYPPGRQRKKIALEVLKNWDRQIKETHAKITQEKSLAPLLRDSLQLNLAYYLDASSLTKIRRSLRLFGESRAIKKAGVLLTGERAFLQSIIEKIKAFEVE